MTQVERLKNRLDALERRFADIYEKCTVGNRECFCAPGGILFALDYLGSFGAVVIEYAENYEEAELNRFEDGDLFYLEDMDEDTMFDAMLWEIRQ